MKFLIIYDEKHLLIEQVEKHLLELGHEVEFSKLSAYTWVTSDAAAFSKFDSIYFDRPTEASAFFWQQNLLLSAQAVCTKIHNDPASYAIFRNKAAGTLWLKEHGFPVPETIISQSLESAMQSLAAMTWEKVMAKPIYGHSGLGIFGFRKNEIPLPQLNQALEAEGLLYLQEFIPTKPVRDLRIDMVGEQIICSYFRNNLRNEEYPVCNISRGGVHEYTTVPSEIASEARRLMKLSGLTFAGIDLIWNQKTMRYEWVEVNPEPNAAEWQPELALAIANSMIAQALHAKPETDSL